MVSPYLFRSTTLIEPTNKCNLGCEFCEANCTVNAHLKRRDITPEQLEIMLAKLSELIINIVFQGDCEPTLNPYLPELTRIAARFTSSVALVTNGTRLKEMYVRRLVEAGMSWFAISIDDYRPEVFNQVRRGADLEKIQSSLRALIRLRDRERPDLHVVVHKIVFPGDTLEELRTFVRTYYLDYGVNQITFAPLVQMGDIKVRDWLKLRNRLESAMIDEGVYVNLGEFCPYPYRTLHRYCGTNLLFISHEGNLSPCGLHVRQGRSFGSLLEHDLEELAQGERFRELHAYWQDKRYSRPIPAQCHDCFLLKGHYHRYSLNEGHQAGLQFLDHPDLAPAAADGEEPCRHLESA